MKTSILAICFSVVLASSAMAQVDGNYMVNKEWARLPPGMTWDASTTNVAVDGKGSVVVLVRTAPYFRVFDRDGNFVKAWGEEELFSMAHSAVFDHEGYIWTTDARAHVVHKFSADGELLMTLGTPGIAGDNTSTDAFNQPNAVAVAPNGDVYVSDGYINARIVHFNRSGEFLRIIGGTEGAGAGELQLPHGVGIDSTGRILVNDSDNQRISVFDSNGDFVEAWDVPSRGNLVITDDDTVYVSDVNAGSVSIVRNGEVVGTIGDLGRPHGLTIDTDGTIYASDSSNRVVMKITPRN